MPVAVAHWHNRNATIKLASNLCSVAAQPIFVMSTIGDLAPIHFVFAWSHSNNMSLISGQMNFFTLHQLDLPLICAFR